jgi:hypothetical protein
LVIADLGLDHLSAEVPDPRESAFLVQTHMGGKAHHISRKNG